MIRAFLGPPGSGKTLACTAFAYRKHQAGRKIVANYRLNFPHTHFDVQNLQSCKLDEHHVLALDDAYLLLNSRSYMRNTPLVDVILQAKLRGTDIFVVAPELDWLDKRIREADVVRCHCQYNETTKYVTACGEQLHGPDYFSLYDHKEIKLFRERL